MDAVGELPRSGERRRVRARVEGTVQGVGFRPYAYRLARELGVAGFVLNDARGVVLEVEGNRSSVERFLERLPAEVPPLAAVERVLPEDVAPSGERGFRIVASEHAGEPSAAVAPDGATCDACLEELFDPADRRHRYPFVNCTDCGPRFTIVRGVPYDRPFTTMAGFTMCPACQAEYDDPADRRFHAQPNACPDCGPSLRLVGSDGPAEDPLGAAVRALGDGAVVALKGIGGFHLACLAADEAAVARLRSRKHREDKPFALMAPSLDAARALVRLSAEDEDLLISRERPIVLAPRRPGVDVAEQVAPGAPELGVMLPYSPLHHLVLADCEAPLVLTSGNVSDEPIAFRDEEAVERLGDIADLFLGHDRPIHTRTDDSVARTVAIGSARRPLLVRRSRGHVPAELRLPVAAARPLLACGPMLKNTFCLARDERAWVGHHIGDLENYETLRSFTDGIEHFERLFAVEPAVVAHDLHPEYLSTKYALEREGVEPLGVQHHHAHLAACLAEHGERGPVVGAIFDGTGYGSDGTVWGGELLFGDLAGFERDGHLWPLPMPGGEAAIREPWRMACAWLEEAEAGARRRGAGGVGPGEGARPLGRGLAHHLERRPPVRRRLGAVRGLHRDQLRGSGGDRARGRVRPGRAGRLPDAARAAPPPGAARRASHGARGSRGSRPARARGRGGRALPQRPGRRHRARLRGARAAQAHLDRGALRRQLPQPQADRAHRSSARERGAARAHPRAAATGRRRRLLRAGGRGSRPAGDGGQAVSVLDQRVHAGGRSKRFGELTLEDVSARADELRSVGGWGPTVKVVPVAQAWAELARTMAGRGAATVADLGEEEAAARAERLWVIPPGGSLLPG